MQVLLVEDEGRVADFIWRGLKNEGWSVMVASNGETALEFLARETFDVVILDLILPGISGQELCQRMRARKDLTPVLMLTALGKTDDRVAGLRLGADDYLAKPFDFDELLARLEALVRRRHAFKRNDRGTDMLIVGPIRFDGQSLEVYCDDTLIDLTAKERDVLSLFLSNPGKVLSRERILNAAWGANVDPMNNVVDVYIGRLRRKLGSAGDMIGTVRGAGYRLIAPQ